MKRVGAVILAVVVGLVSIIGRSFVRLRDSERKMAEEYLDDLRQRLASEGINVEAVLVEGVASETVVGHANAHGFDLIAMSTHGRSGLRRLVLGSVADHVVRRSGTPVLLVRGEG